MLVRRPPRFACRSRATAPKLDLTLGYQSMTLNGTPGQALIAYYTEPGTPEHDAITLLDRFDADHISVPDI